MIAIVLLTKTPASEWLDFFPTLKQPGYDLFIAVDDNSIIYKDTEPLRFIQYDDEDCIRTGFTNSNFIIRDSGPTAWDKAIRYFCENTQYEHVWFVEDDVFIPTSHTISAMDTKYPDADILSASIGINNEGTMGWNWRHAKGKIALPWANSSVYVVRLSRAVLTEVYTYVREHMTLLFIEIMFHTVALHKSLKIQAIPELTRILWRIDWTFDDVNSRGLLHPVKDMSLHTTWHRQLQKKEEENLRKR
jgi:hypothetical protein